ncbi:carboxymuconolactone decarboxylase family protein [Mastigocoleus testarum]|uniref:Alkylhydroperoxidase n=1 Tax=Mastigocoleus testarum BC008 TaxID=371196 RepID=A0A0V7ZD48_9CYAN|nr:hypothetical protein [Mastigocoleus testarum]KST62449.1 alkylhydroperoxidase [Mastigocoleus testarum BC008]
MTRVPLVKPDAVEDPQIEELFNWVTQMEGAVPDHFYMEMNFPEYFKAKLGSSKILWQMGELSISEIQHVGILVSKANNCPYCTAAFCTILNYGLGTEEEYVTNLASQGIEAVEDNRLKTILDFVLKTNNDPKSLEDEDFNRLRAVNLTDKGIVQLVHLVGDFASYNHFNLALQTDYHFRDIWRTVAFPGNS